jgi:hypothetical protein
MRLNQPQKDSTQGYGIGLILLSKPYFIYIYIYHKYDRCGNIDATMMIILKKSPIQVPKKMGPFLGVNIHIASLNENWRRKLAIEIFIYI